MNKEMVGIVSAIIAAFSLFAWIVVEVGKSADEARDALEIRQSDRIDRLDNRSEERFGRVIGEVVDIGKRVSKNEAWIALQGTGPAPGSFRAAQDHGLTR